MRYMIAILLLLCLAAPASAEMCVAVDELENVILSGAPCTAEQMEANVQGLQKKPLAYTILCGPEAEAAYRAWEEAERERRQ